MFSAKYTEVIETIYSLWPWIVGFSVICGIISIIIAFKNKIKNTISAIFVGILLFVLMVSFFVGIGFVRVPALYGMKVRDANLKMKDLRLNLVLPSSMIMDDETSEILIKGQNVEEGKLVFQYSSILVDLEESNNRNMDRSTEYVSMPNVVGKKYLDAMEELTGIGLFTKISQGQPTNITLEEAYVSAQSIMEKAYVPFGSYVAITLTSKKDELSTTLGESMDVIVPNLINQKVDEGIDSLLAAEFAVSVWPVLKNNESSEDYYIVYQSIMAGSKVSKGTRIEIKQSKHKIGEQVIVPYVIGLEQIEAVSLLQQEGLSFQVSLKSSDVQTASTYYIIGQSIEAGTEVPSETIVKLELSSNKP